MIITHQQNVITCDKCGRALQLDVTKDHQDKFHQIKSNIPRGWVIIVLPGVMNERAYCPDHRITIERYNIEKIEEDVIVRR